MTDEEKRLLACDLAARLPFDVKCQFTLKYGDNGHKEGIYLATITTFDGKDWLDVEYNDTSGASGKLWMRDWSCALDDIKPYLRPMESMTEEEAAEFDELSAKLFEHESPENIWGQVVDWMNAHYLDFRGLILMGLAIAVTENNNPYK